MAWMVSATCGGMSICLSTITVPPADIFPARFLDMASAGASKPSRQNGSQHHGGDLHGRAGCQDFQTEDCTFAAPRLGGDCAGIVVNGLGIDADEVPTENRNARQRDRKPAETQGFDQHPGAVQEIRHAPSFHELGEYVCGIVTLSSAYYAKARRSRWLQNWKTCR